MQGPTLPAARLLRLTRSDAPREIQVETAPLDVLDADLLTVAIPRGSRLHGVTVVPDRDTVLRAGDELLLITTPHTREVTERRLRAIGRRGKLARWLGEHGAPEPEPGTPARTTAGQW